MIFALAIVAISGVNALMRQRSFFLCLLVAAMTGGACLGSVYEEVFARIGTLKTGGWNTGFVLGPDGNFYGLTCQGGPGSGGTAFRVTLDGKVGVVHSFQSGHSFEHFAPYGLAVGHDGNMYGVTTEEGGALFRLTTDGGLSRVNGTLSDDPAALQYGQLLQRPDGSIYGTDFGYGSAYGSVYGLSNEGRFLFRTSFNSDNGAHPRAGLIAGADGNFYGTTEAGGANNLGTIFRVTSAGEVSSLFSFAGIDGSKPRSALLLAPDGNYYGTTYAGGINNSGTIYRVSPAAGLTTIFSFGPGAGSSPGTALTLGPDSCLYGTTEVGGTGNLGTFYRITLGGEFKQLATFPRRVGFVPLNGLILGPDGQFYGVMTYGNAFRAMRSGNITLLATLGDDEGFGPASGVIEASDGNFYGSTANGPGGGTIFRVTPGGKASDLCVIDEATTGAGPGRIVQAPDGNLYGATYGLGAPAKGFVFRATLQGQIETLRQLDVTTGFGVSDFLLGRDGSCFGLARFGGANNRGTIFRVTTEGAVSVYSNLHLGVDEGRALSFMQDTHGVFYGTAEALPGLPGGVFKVDLAGEDTVLANFSSYAYGGEPQMGVIKGVDGNFYGTTEVGAANGHGSVFRMTPEGTLSLVASFPNTFDFRPFSSLALGDDGAFYGTTGEFSFPPIDNHGGAFFRLTSDGDLTFPNVFDATGGSGPGARFIRASDGYFYGTMTYGGSGGGVVIRFTTNPPVVDLVQPPSGSPGDPIVITGRYLAGTKSVKFHGLPASFHIDDSRHITAIVPNGASSGAIEVANPIGAVSSDSFVSPPADNDGDGMPDDFESRFFGSATGADPSADADGDGQTNLAEYRAGTSPTDSASILAFSDLRKEGDDIVIHFHTSAYKRYRVIASDEWAGGYPLVIGTVDPSPTAGTGEVIDVLGANHGRRFYRIEVIPGDGATLLSISQNVPKAERMRSNSDRPNAPKFP